MPLYTDLHSTGQPVIMLHNPCFLVGLHTVCNFLLHHDRNTFNRNISSNSPITIGVGAANMEDSQPPSPDVRRSPSPQDHLISTFQNIIIDRHFDIIILAEGIFQNRDQILINLHGSYLPAASARYWVMVPIPGPISRTMFFL